MKRSKKRERGGYGQFCPMATALDVVGQRWTLLVLRDLARAPLRFSDLQAINPALSPTLLTQRLRSLEAAGIIERRSVRRPAKTVLYALTESARPAIGPVLTALVGLGAYLLEGDGPAADLAADPAELLAEQMRLNGHFVLARGSNLEGYFVFDFKAWATHVVISEVDFVVSAKKPSARRPQATATFSPPTTMVRIMGRVLAAEDAERDGSLAIDGDRDAMLELLGLLSFADPEG